jgi:ribose transport system permease protein
MTATTEPSSEPVHQEPGEFAAPSRTWVQRLGFDRYSALYLWAGFMFVFRFTQTEFLTWTSINLVLTEKAIVAMLALAFLVPLVADTFDLSIGVMMGFSVAITTALAQNTGNPQALNALIAVLACAGVGFVSGFIVVKLNVNSFIATLGMSQVLVAANILISGNRTINGVLSDAYRDFGRTKLLGLPLYFYFMIVVALIVWYVLEQTPLGRYLFATGGNLEAARLSGLRTDLYRWGTLVASAVIASFAGLIHTWKVGTYSSSIGPGFLFPAVAAVFFGASQLKGRPNVWGTLIAVYALAFGVKGLQLTFTSGTAWIEPLFEGVSLLIAVALASRQGVIKVPKRKKREGTGADVAPGSPARPASDVAL